MPEYSDSLRHSFSKNYFRAMICLGPVCIPAVPLFLVMLKPLWMLLPQGIKNWLYALWLSIAALLFGKAKIDEVSHESDALTIANSWSDIASEPIAIVDFGAVWCGPCALIAPVFYGLAVEFKDKATFFSVNVDNSQELAVDEGVSSLPAFHFYKNGKLVDSLIGADAVALRSKIEAICS